MTTPDEQILALERENRQLRLAAAALLDRYVGLVESGDAGTWDVTYEPAVVEMRRLLQFDGSPDA